ncbi:MAG: DUF3565 domain-containing protein [Ilumatobacteraceae bacterium]
MNRRILGFTRDDAGDWIAELGCIHRQHVRHQPPFRDAAWVLDEHTRAQRIGTTLDCPLCDRAELPDGLDVVRTTATWNEHTAPEQLRRAHRIASGTWGRLRVISGRLHFAADTTPPIEIDLHVGDTQPIPPSVSHSVDLTEPVQFCIDFLRRPSIDSATTPKA